MLTLKELGAQLGRLISSMVLYRQLTLGQFCKEYPKGAWFVLIPRHALCVIDGRPVDLYYGKHKKRAMIQHAWEILNARPVVQVTMKRAARQPGRQRIKLLVSRNPFHGPKIKPLHVAGQEMFGRQVRPGSTPWRRFEMLLTALRDGVDDPAKLPPELPRTALARWQRKGYILLEEV